MAQGPSDTILVAIRITLRIRESKVRNPDHPYYSLIVLCRVRLRFVLSERILVISVSTGPIFIKFSPYGRYLIVDYWSDLIFPIPKGCCNGNQFCGQNWRNRPVHFHLSPWHSKTEWNISQFGFQKVHLQ